MPLIIFAKITILDVWQSAEYNSANTFELKRVFVEKINNFFILFS